MLVAVVANLISAGAVDLLPQVYAYVRTYLRSTAAKIDSTSAARSRSRATISHVDNNAVVDCDHY